MAGGVAGVGRGARDGRVYGRSRGGGLWSLGDVGENLLGRTGLVVDHSQATLPPALVLFVRELNHVGQRLLRSFRLVLVENQCAVLRSQVEQGGCVASVASLAVVVLVEAAGIHLEDDDVLEGCVWQSGLALYIADTLGGFGEVWAEPVGDELDFNLPSCCVTVQDDAGLFDKGSDGVANDFLFDATGRRGLADDQVDALLRC